VTTYVFENAKTGQRVERDFRIGKAPKRIKSGCAWYSRIITPCAFSIEKVDGMHSPGRMKHAVRNKHDIREIEARNEHVGLKWNPDAYQRDRSVPVPKEVA
jgi:hypothetical protein